MSALSLPQKRCLCGDQCKHPDGPHLPATTEYYYADTNYSDGLKKRCKECAKAYQKQYNARPEKRELHREYEAGRRNNPEFRESRRVYLANYTPPPESLERKRERARCHAREDHVRARARELNRTPEYRERNRNYRREHAERNRELHLAYYYRVKGTEAHRQIKQAAQNRRRARTRLLPYTLTVAQWRDSLTYFSHHCAYCDVQFSEVNKPTLDHIVPVSAPDCPGTVAANVVPACPQCNYSKGAADFKDWATWRFQADHTAVISRIETYRLHHLDSY